MLTKRDNLFPQTRHTATWWRGNLLTLWQRGYLILIALVTIGWCSTMARAEEEDPSLSDFDHSELDDWEISDFDDVELFDLTVPEVVFAAGRREQTVTSLPYAISVITADDIHRTGVQTVPDALRLVLTDELYLAANWYFVDDMKSPSQRHLLTGMAVPEYHRLDLTTIYEFWEDCAALTVGVKNLLDNQHPEGGSLLLNDTEVPRMIFAELRLSLP